MMIFKFPKPNYFVRRVAAALSLLVAAAVAVPGTASLLQAQQAGGEALSRVEADVDGSYPDVSHLSTAKFAGIAKKKPLMIFDVREIAEFAVSRIKGSLRVSPGTWSSSFLAKHGRSVKGKVVVFYCSVGVRSSKLASRVQAELLKRGASGVYNLRGGIFRWHNERRALVNGRGATDFVHPYDARWGRLVERQEMTGYGPIN